MTREEVKTCLPIMQAYVEGKQIQYLYDEWKDIDKLTTDLYINPELYRIKPESKYRPFKDAEECWQEMQKHQPFGWIKCEEGYFNIDYVNDDYVGLVDADGYNSSILLVSKNSYQGNTFADGAPFGILEEE